MKNKVSGCPKHKPASYILRDSCFVVYSANLTLFFISFITVLLMFSGLYLEFYPLGFGDILSSLLSDHPLQKVV